MWEEGTPTPLNPCLPPSGGHRSYNRYYCQLELGLVVDFSSECMHHKVLTYIEYRAVSGVFRTILLTPPPSTQLVCPPPHQRRGGTHSPGGEGVGGQYFGRRQTLDWPLTVKSLYGMYHGSAASEHTHKHRFLHNLNMRHHMMFISKKCQLFRIKCLYTGADYKQI